MDKILFGKMFYDERRCKEIICYVRQFIIEGGEEISKTCETIIFLVIVELITVSFEGKLINYPNLNFVFCI